MRLEVDMFSYEYTDEDRKTSSGGLRAGTGSYCLINWQTWTHVGSFN